jgi:hypothetical protein
MLEWGMIKWRYRKYRLRQKQAEELGKFFFTLANASYVAAMSWVFSIHSQSEFAVIKFTLGIGIGMGFAGLALKLLKEVKT